MKPYEREILINRPIEVVFDFFADMTRMPEWAPEDFVSANRADSGPIGRGSTFVLITKGARAEARFTWAVYNRPSVLEFSSPRLDVGPGWVEGSGGFTFERRADSTLARAWFAPRLGGILRLMSPFARMRNVRLLSRQLARAKEQIELKE